MKTKLLATVLSVICLLQPVMAIGMVDMESATEITSAVTDTIEESKLSAQSFSSEVILFESFDNHAAGTGDVTPEYSAGPLDTAKISTGSLVDTGNGNMAVSANLGSYSWMLTNVNTFKNNVGLYKFYIDVEVTSENAPSSDNGVTVNFGIGDTWTPINDAVYVGIGETKTIVGVLEVFKDESEKILYRTPTNTDPSWSVKESATNGWNQMLNKPYISDIRIFSSKVGDSGVNYNVTCDNLKIEYYADAEVVFFENYDRQSGTGYVNAPYAAGSLAGVQTYLEGTTDLGNGNKANVATKTGTGEINTPLFYYANNFNNVLGTYKFYIDATVNATNVTAGDSGLDLYFKARGNFTSMNDPTRVAIGETKTIEGCIVLFKKEDGSIVYATPTNTDPTYSATEDPTPLDNFRICFQGVNTTATYTVTYDNFRVEYYPEEAEPEQADVAVSFCYENGKSLSFKDIAENGVYVLPSASDLGLNYDVEYVVNDENGAVVYPGMPYTFDASCQVGEFVVRKTDVIFYESYDNQTAGTSYVGAEYAIGPMAGATIYPDGIKDVGDGDNEYVVTKTGSGEVNTTIIDNVNNFMNKPGVYKFYTDATVSAVNTTEADEYLGIYFKAIGSWSTMNDSVAVSIGETKTIEASIVLYEKADGTLVYKTPMYTNPQWSAKDVTTSISNIRISFNGVNTEATYTVSYDNTRVEYYPYAPENTMKAGYRSNDNDNGGPEGIRFAAYVTDEQRNVASEYGFVVTIRESLGGDYKKLNLSGIDAVSETSTTSGVNEDGIRVVAAASYKENVVDKIYSIGGSVFGLDGIIDDTFYTAVLYGIDDDEKKETVFVARPYAKIDGIYYYGDCHEASYNDVKAAADAANA